jgi:hypothetical protein
VLITDDMIARYGENDHAEYFRIGDHIHVTWMAGYQKYACLECRSNKCEHTAAVKAFRERRAAQ